MFCLQNHRSSMCEKHLPSPLDEATFSPRGVYSKLKRVQTSEDSIAYSERERASFRQLETPRGVRGACPRQTYNNCKLPQGLAADNGVWGNLFPINKGSVDFIRIGSSGFLTIDHVFIKVCSYLWCV